MVEFETFYRKHVRLVYGLARARAGGPEQAEDLTQETFLRAWRSFGGLSGMEPAAQRAWLMRTVRNLSIDAWRRREVEVVGSTMVAGSAWEGAQQESELHLDVVAALGELEEGDRELVVMRYVEEMNSREIGEALGRPEGTVRRRLARCRELLARRLAQWGPEEAE